MVLKWELASNTEHEGTAEMSKSLLPYACAAKTLHLEGIVGGHLGHLGQCWGHLGATLGVLGSSWGNFGGLGGVLGSTLGFRVDGVRFYHQNAHLFEMPKSLSPYACAAKTPV